MVNCEENDEYDENGGRLLLLLLFVLWEAERARREGSTDLGLLSMLEEGNEGLSSEGDHIKCEDACVLISRMKRISIWVQRRKEFMPGQADTSLGPAPLGGRRRRRRLFL